VTFVSDKRSTTAALAELSQIPQWVAYRMERRDGKDTKIPYNPNKPSLKAKADDPTTWGTYSQAKTCQRQNKMSGVGFEILASDPFAGVDLDHCISGGKVEPWAQEIVDGLNSYTEITPSGEGLRIWVKGKLPPAGRHKGHIEMYDSGRFFTVTGNHLEGTPKTIEERQAELEALHVKVWPEAKAPTMPPPTSTPLDLPDNELIQRALAAKNGAEFGRLWSGDFAAYPSQSEADQAFCNYLAFWTGNDPVSVDRLFRQSGLYREKWNRKDYRERTIKNAVSSTREVYSPSERGPRLVLKKDAEKETAESSTVPTRPDVTSGLNLTDMGNAERLVAMSGGDIRYCHNWDKWITWDNSRWIRDEAGTVERLAKRAARSIYAEASNEPDDSHRKEIARHAVRSESDQRIRAMVNLAKSEPSVPVSPQQFDRDPWLFKVLNGEIDLKTGLLLPHSRDNLITKLAPVIYDPAATSELWERFLNDATNGNKELQAFLQRAVGYALTGDTREEVLFFVHGPAAAGKSTFLEAIKAIMGDYAATANFDTFLWRRDIGSARNDIARLATARLVSSIEVDEGKKLAEGVVKAITGRDTITARFLYREEFEFNPSFKLFLAANHAPKVSDDDDAMWRRILRIPFEHVVPKEQRDPTLKATLRDTAISGSAILNWAIAGCLEWQQIGLGVPPVVEQATEAYRQDMDPLAGFFDECCLFSANRWTPASDIRKAYQEWAKSNGERDGMPTKEFADRLRRKGCEQAHGRSNGRVLRGWKGIELLDGGSQLTAEFEEGEI
jgi:putative DNA primase/helicase